MPDMPGRPPAGGGEPLMTRLESDEEIRQALEARRARPPTRGQPAPTAAPADAEADVQPDRPVQRPPLGLLCILDDGRADGEWVRLRAERTVIGRVEGDVVIGHDTLLSGRHAEIVRRVAGGGYRWVLLDLGSTNGSFVRIGATLLRHETEFVVGSGRYRFEAGLSAAAFAAPAAAPAQGTQAWSGAPVRALVPSLVEVTPAGPVQQFSLTLPEYWIGRDPQACAIARPGDVLANPRHARLHRDAKGQWHVENHKSLNGLWLRVEEIPLGNACQFRLGEQKFLFKVP